MIARVVHIVLGTLAMIACAALAAAIPAPWEGVSGRDFRPQATTMAILLFALAIVLRARLRWPLADLLGALIGAEVFTLLVIASFSGYAGLEIFDSFNLWWLGTMSLFVAVPWLAGMAAAGLRTPAHRARRPGALGSIPDQAEPRARGAASAADGLTRAAEWSAWIVLAALAGVVLGVAGRLAMRAVALQSGLGGEFSAGGSLEVVLFGVFLGAPVALVYWFVRRRVSLPPGSGVLAGLGLFTVMALWPPGPARSALEGTTDPPPVTAAIFAAAFLVYGLSLDLFWKIKRSR